MTRHFVYILALKDGSLYTGYTTDPKRRLKEHNLGQASKYTRGRLPARMVYVEEVPSRGEGLSREYRIKQLKRPAKEALIREYLLEGGDIYEYTDT